MNKNLINLRKNWGSKMTIVPLIYFILSLIFLIAVISTESLIYGIVCLVFSLISFFAGVITQQNKEVKE